MIFNIATRYLAAARVGSNGRTILAQRSKPLPYPVLQPQLEQGTVLWRALHLAPRETDHLLLHSAGRLAQYRLARGLRLNVPEARALIAMQMM